MADDLYTKKQSIQDWEAETKSMVRDLGKQPLTKLVTHEEYFALEVVGINLEDRTAFLESRGIPVTRQNLLDPQAGSPRPEAPPEPTEE